MTELQLQKQRERRKKNGNAITKKYEKTKKGFLMRAYRNMKSRIEGIQKKKYHLYKGKELLDKELFYSWSLEHPEFNRLFKDYEDSGYTRKLAPSPDRIDSRKGYTIENIQWVTTSENSANVGRKNNNGITDTYREIL